MLPFPSPVVYIERTSPATAGVVGEATFPVMPSQTAPWPFPSEESENNTGARIMTGGLYTSAAAGSLGWYEGKPCDAVMPPAISTWPLLRRVAVWQQRPVIMLPAGVNPTMAGSYSS